MSDLFRKAAVDNQRNRLYGDVLVLPRFAHSAILGALLLWVFLVVLWLVTSSYARKETVLGWLEPPSGIVRVYPEANGTVRSVLVSEGERVEKDQALIIINSDRTLLSGDGLEAQLLDEYQVQRKLLMEELDRTRSIGSGKSDDIGRRIGIAESELVLLGQQLRTLDQRRTLVRNQVERSKGLRDSGYISGVEYDNVAAQELAIRGERQSLQRSLIAQQDLIRQLQAESDALPNESAIQIGQLQERLSTITQRILQQSGQSSHVIRAARAGITNNLQAIEGQQTLLGSTVPLLTLIPDDARLTAHLLIPVRSVGFVAPGQPLEIRYDAFPHQKFGLYGGVIDAVSRTLLLPNELLNAPLAVNEPVYRLTASLKSQAATAYGREFPLKPGMTFSADIGLGERSLLEWLLEPILSVRGQL